MHLRPPQDRVILSEQHQAQRQTARPRCRRSLCYQYVVDPRPCPRSVRYNGRHVDGPQTTHAGDQDGKLGCRRGALPFTLLLTSTLALAGLWGNRRQERGGLRRHNPHSVLTCQNRRDAFGASILNGLGAASCRHCSLLHLPLVPVELLRCSIYRPQHCQLVGRTHIGQSVGNPEPFRESGL